MFINTETLEILSARKFKEQNSEWAINQSSISDAALEQLGTYARLHIEQEKPAYSWNQKCELGAPYNDNGTWRRSYEVTDMTDFEEAQVYAREEAECLIKVDTKAGEYREVVNRYYPYQGEAYQIKEAEALAYKANPALTASELPMLFAQVGGADGSTVDECADLYIAKSVPWRQLLALIERARVDAKAAVRAGNTPDEKKAAVQAANWQPVIDLLAQIAS